MCSSLITVAKMMTPIVNTASRFVKISPPSICRRLLLENPNDQVVTQRKSPNPATEITPFVKLVKTALAIDVGEHLVVK